MVKTGKWFGIVVAIFAIGVAPLIDKAGGGLFDLMKNLAALYNIPLLAVVVMAIFSKRTPAVAAFVAIFAGVGFYAWFGLVNKIPDSDLRMFFGHELHWLHIAGINFVFLIVIMLICRFTCPRSERHEQSHSGDVDITPWKFALPAGIAILILIAVMYAAMSRFG